MRLHPLVLPAVPFLASVACGGLTEISHGRDSGAESRATTGVPSQTSTAATAAATPDASMTSPRPVDAGRAGVEHAASSGAVAAEAGGDASARMDAASTWSRADAGSSETGADADSDAGYPCTFATLPSCVGDCECWLGLPASCFPPGVTLDAGLLDEGMCSTYCPTDLDSLGSFCGPAPDPGATYSGIGGTAGAFDGGAAPAVYCLPAVCMP